MSFNDALTIVIGREDAAMKTKGCIGYFRLSATVPSASSGFTPEFGIEFRYRSGLESACPVFPVMTDSVTGYYVVAAPSVSTDFTDEVMALMFRDDWYVSTVEKCERARQKAVVDATSLKFTCLSADLNGNAAVTLQKAGSPSAVSLEYSKTGVYWRDYTVGTALSVAVGSSVFFRAKDSTSVFSSSADDYYYFTCSGSGAMVGSYCSKWDATGCVMSLLDKDLAITTPSDCAFYGLFSGMGHGLRTAPTLPSVLSRRCLARAFAGCKSLVSASLPAGVLSAYCYEEIFSGCSSLPFSGVTMPASVTLAEGCCKGMFKNCLSAGIPSQLPVWNAQYQPACFEEMFYGCTGITNANDAHLTSGSSYPAGCFRNMFFGCTSLTTGPAMSMSVTVGAESCRGMFRGCTSMVTRGLNTMTVTSVGNYGLQEMFYGCTSLTTPAVAMAGSLSVGCYKSMFRGCTSLTSFSGAPYVTAMAESCYEEMFYGCVSMGSYPACVVTPTGGTGLTMAANCWKYMFYGCTRYYTVPTFSVSSYAEGCLYGTFCECSNVTTIAFGQGYMEGAALTVPPYCFYRTYSGTKASGEQGMASLAQGFLARKLTLGQYSFCRTFEDCTNLYEDLLNATGLEFDWTLAPHCCEGMFSGCTSLKNVSSGLLPAVTLAESCYADMFSGCTGLLQVPDLPATVLQPYCYHQMFRRCTSVTACSGMAAVTLAEESCGGMFMQCSGLAAVTVRFANWTDGFGTTNWVSGVASSGTFTCPYAIGFSDTIPDSGYGPSGIPSSSSSKWTVAMVGSYPGIRFTANSAGSSVSIPCRQVTGSGVSDAVLYYSTDGSTWTRYPKGTAITLASVGDYVQFRASSGGNHAVINLDNSLLYDGAADDFDGPFDSDGYITIVGSVRVSGNLVSMWDATLEKTGFTDDYDQIGSLFYNCTGLTHDASDPLVIPITEMQDTSHLLIYGLMTGMFYGCTALVSAPRIRIGTLRGYACTGMFEGCTSLASAPVMDFTVADTASYYGRGSLGHCSYRCCARMFKGCTALTSATVNLTTMSEGCCQSMFEGCTGLCSLTLMAQTLVKDCYRCIAKNAVANPTGGTTVSVTTHQTSGQMSNDYTYDWLLTDGTTHSRLCLSGSNYAYVRCPNMRASDIVTIDYDYWASGNAYGVETSVDCRMWTPVGGLT